MTRLLLVASLFLSSAAYACPGSTSCGSCPMPTAAGASTASAALPAGTQGSLDVTGMHCGACADKVKNALLKVDGVRGATVDHASGKAQISFDDKKTNLDALVKAVNTTGFQAKVSPPPQPTKTN